MNISDLRYQLIPENIEGTPREIRLGNRDRGRLLVVDRAKGKSSMSRVADLPGWCNPGDVFVLNNSKRIPGVLKGRTVVGGLVELRFVELETADQGLCRIFPTHDVVVGSRIQLSGGHQIQVDEMGVTKYRLARVSSLGTGLRDLLKAQGKAIPGFFYENNWTVDHLNPYYATQEGTVESPLAGLHFTPSLVAALQARGVSVRFVTLHSVGSWLPFLEEDVGEHVMWEESFVVPEETAEAVNEAHRTGKRVFACGSTSLRALESAAPHQGAVRAQTGRTSLYITPGYEFKAVGGYFTNFHQYQTSLIVLDAAFAGAELVMKAYHEASARRLSFYEFGDAVLYI